MIPEVILPSFLPHMFIPSRLDLPGRVAGPPDLLRSLRFPVEPDIVNGGLPVGLQLDCVLPVRPFACGNKRLLSPAGNRETGILWGS